MILRTFERLWLKALYRQKIAPLAAYAPKNLGEISETMLIENIPN